MTLEPANHKPKLAWYQHGWLAMPLALIFVGGALGGLCGGAAWGLNRVVFEKAEHPIFRYVWTGLITVAAFFVWVVLVLIISAFLPKQ